MEFLRKLIVQTQEHLKGLSVSQRLAIGSCVALIAVALMWMVNWAQAPAMKPLLDQPMSDEEITAITADLDSRGVEYQVAEGRVMVNAGDRHRLKGRLAEQQLLPSDTSIGYAKIIENNNAFLSADQQNRRWTLALSNELARTLSNFSWIKGARVFINDTQKRRISGPSLRPSASVNVALKRNNELDEGRVQAIANFVSGSVPGMKPHDVNIIDSNGQPYRVRKDGRSSLAYDDLKVRQKKEEYFKENILDLLNYIPNIRVRVHAEMDPEYRVENSVEYGEPFPETKEMESETRKEGMDSKEPGVVPNTARQVATGTPTRKTEREHMRTAYKGEVDYKQTRTESHRYGIKRLFASVFVPRSYLAAIYKQAHDGEEPTSEELDEAASTQKILRDIRTKVLCALGATEDEPDKGVVEVGWCYDGADTVLADTMTARADQGVMQYVENYGGKVGLGLLAVASLFMMLMMVRKIGEGPVVPGEEAPSKLTKRHQGQDEVEFTVNDDVSEALASEPLMTAQEMDEATLQTQRVVDQIGELVKDDPDTSAAILERWIKEDL